MLHFGGGQVGCALADTGRERHRGFAMQTNPIWSRSGETITQLLMCEAEQE